MSTIETLPQRQRARRLLWRSLPSETIATPRSARSPWQAMLSRVRDNRPLRLSLLCWLAAWIVLETAFVGWAHYACEGKTHRAFLPGANFGLPAVEVAEGLDNYTHNGYDGQFYYHMSNDLFGRFDAAQHIDNVLYRYQRIGIPMLAGGLASLLGFKCTPSLLYHTVQFGITTAGFGVLVYWLTSRRQPAVYALAWLCSVGTLESLWSGLLDAPADALFACALFAVLSRRLWLYVPVATLLLLTREMYCLFAVSVFAATAFSRVAVHDAAGGWRPIPSIDWGDVRSYALRVSLAALPIVVMLSWTLYLAAHFDKSPIEARTSNPGNYGLPFDMMCRYVEDFFKDGNHLEFRLAVVSSCTLITVVALVCRGVRRLPLAILCTIPYLLMLTALGKSVWEHHSSHMRVIDSALVVIGLFLLPFDKSMLLRFVLVLQGAAGIGTHAETQFMSQPIRSDYLCEEAWHYPALGPGEPDNERLTNVASAVEWADFRPEIARPYRGVWKSVHRELKPVTVAVTNNTDQTWQPGFCKHPLWIGYRMYDEGKHAQFAAHSVLLDQAIEPGETKEVTLYLEILPRRRTFLVEFSVRQDGVWFSDVDQSYGRQYVFALQ